MPESHFLFILSQFHIIIKDQILNNLFQAIMLH